MRLRSVVFRIVFWVVTFLVVFSAGLTALLETGALTTPVVEAVDGRVAKYGLALSAGSLHWRPWSGLSLEDVRLMTRGDSTAVGRHLVSVGRVEGGYRLIDLLRADFRLTRVGVVRPDVDLDALLAWSSGEARADTAAAGPKPAAAPDTTAPARRATVPSFRIDELRISHGRIRAQGGDALSGLELDGRLASTNGVWDLDVEGARSRMRLGRFDEDVQMAGRFGLADGMVSMDSVRVTSAGGSVHLRGKMDPRGRKGSELFLHGESVPLRKVGQWFGVEHPLLLADLAAEIVVTGRPDSMHVAGSLMGRREDDVPRDIDFALTRQGRRLEVHAFTFRAGESLVDMTGLLDLDAGPRIECVAELRNLEPAIALADSELAPVGAVNGVVRIEGTGLTRETFRGAADLRLQSARVFGFRVAAGDMRLALYDGTLRVNEARLSVEETKLVAEGTLDAANRVDAVLRGDVADLADVAPPKDGVERNLPSGQATIELQLKGPLAAPALQATIVMQDASWGGVDAGRLEVEARCEELGKAAQFDFSVRGAGIGKGSRRFEQFAAEGFADAKAVVLRAAELISPVGGVRLAGRFDYADADRPSGKLDRLEVRADETNWKNATAISVSRSDAGWNVTGLDLRGGDGSVSGQVVVDAQGVTTVRGSGKNLDLSLLAPFLPASREPSGRVSFEGSGTFGKTTMNADVMVTLGKSRAGAQEIDGMEGRISLRDDRATFEDVSIRLPFAAVDLKGSVAFAPGGLRAAFGDSASRGRALESARFEDLSVRVESSDFDWLWTRIPRMPARGGEGVVELSMHGPFLTPAAEIHAELSNGRLGEEPMDIFQGAGTFDGQTLTLRDGFLKSGDGEIVYSGTLPLLWTAKDLKPRFVPGRELGLSLSGKQFPLAALAPITSLFQMLTGTADATLTLQGQSGAIYFAGDFSVTNGRLVIPTFDDALRDGTGTGRFDANGIELTEGRFVDGRGGEVTGSGRVTMANLRPLDYAIDVQAKDYHYRSQVTGITGNGSGSMKILARKGADGRILPFFEGSFRVERADLSEKALTPPSMAAREDELPPGIVAPPSVLGEPAVADATVPSPGTAGRNGAAPGRATGPAEPHGQVGTHGPLEADASVQGSPILGPVVAPPPAARPIVLAEIALRGDRNLWVKTSEMDIEFAGNVVFTSTERYMGITGNVRSLRGNYTVLNSRFDVNRGEVEFTDAKDIGVSYIDAEAESNVLEEKVTAVVTGTLAAPVIRLSTESGMSEPEIYELLALRIKRDGGTEEEPGLAGKAFRDSYLAAFTNRFGGSLGREIGLDTFAYDAGDERSGQSVTVGKNVGRDFFFKYRESFGADDPTDGDAADPSATRETLETPERALTIEYRLNRMFMLQGETGTLPPGDDYLNVDLRAEWGY